MLQKLVPNNLGRNDKNASSKFVGLGPLQLSSVRAMGNHTSRESATSLNDD